MSGRFFPVAGVHLGPTGSFASFNEETLPLPGMLGQVFEDNGKAYRLVKFDNGASNVASAAGGAAHWKTRADSVVSSDQSDAEATVNGVAGAFLGVVTDLNYCFVQMGGLQTVTTDGSADAGDMVEGTTSDLTFKGTTSPGGVVYGVFYTADGSGTTANMYWFMGVMV